MAQHLHLEHGLLLAHGADLKLLVADDMRPLILLFLLHGCGGFCQRSRVPLSLCRTGTIALHLFFQLAPHAVQGRVHVAGNLFAPENTAFIGDGHLHDVPVPLHGEGYLSFGVLGKIPAELGKLLLGNLPHVIGDLKVFPGNGNLHVLHSFSTGRYGAPCCAFILPQNGRLVPPFL